MSRGFRSGVSAWTNSCAIRLKKLGREFFPSLDMEIRHHPDHLPLSGLHAIRHANGSTSFSSKAASHLSCRARKRAVRASGFSRREPGDARKAAENWYWCSHCVCWVVFRFSSFFLQYRNMKIRSVADWMWVWMVDCLYVALRWTADLFRSSPFRLQLTPVTRKSGTVWNDWMNGSWS